MAEPDPESTSWFLWLALFPLPRAVSGQVLLKRKIFCRMSYMVPQLWELRVLRQKGEICAGKRSLNTQSVRWGGWVFYSSWKESKRKEKGRSKIFRQMKPSCSFSGYNFRKHVFIKHLHELGIMLGGTYAGCWSLGPESQIIPWLGVLQSYGEHQWEQFQYTGSDQGFDRENARCMGYGRETWSCQGLITWHLLQVLKDSELPRKKA